MLTPPGHWITASRPIGSGNGATSTSAPAAGGRDGGVHVRDQIAGPLGAEGIGDRGREAEHRERADRGLHRLEVVLLGVGVTVMVAGGCCAAEGGDEAGRERRHVRGGDVDVGGVVLRRDAAICGVSAAKVGGARAMAAPNAVENRVFFMAMSACS